MAKEISKRYILAGPKTLKRQDIYCHLASFSKLPEPPSVGIVSKVYKEGFECIFPDYYNQRGLDSDTGHLVRDFAYLYILKIKFLLHHYNNNLNLQI